MVADVAQKGSAMLYVYDDTFDGLMTAIFDIYKSRDAEALISSARKIENTSLYPTVSVATDRTKADRVAKGLKKLGANVLIRIYEAWLSKSEGIEDLILTVVRIAFKTGKDPFQQRCHDSVCRLDSFGRKVGWESHRMLQFVRFVKLSEDMYAADIEPEFDILELIGDHFHDRFPMSCFIIRDLRHLNAIVSSPSGWHIAVLPSANPPLPKGGEYEELWRTYFKIIANESRKNLKLQQNFVPLKFRKHLTEFS